jgi:pyruvate-formate lyase-activating enzyme
MDAESHSEVKNFCSYPFQHLSIGQNSDLRACCVAKPFPVRIQEVDDLSSWWRDHAPYNEIRAAHRRDEQHPACSTCWNQESAGFTSMRNLVTRPIADTENFHLTNIEITGGRLCNLACRMCSKYSSNQIDRESRPWDHGRTSGPTNWLDDEREQDKLLEILMTPSLQSIYFTGGEPQIMPCYQQLLSKWADRRDLGSMAMHLNTNCTVYNSEFWSLINRFYHKQIDFSLDATGDIYEIIRYSEFDKARANMLRIRDFLSEKGKNVMSLTIVTQLANVDQGMELQALYDQLTSQIRPLLSYQVLLLPVTGNPEWSWNNLPLEILTAARDKLHGDGEVIQQYRSYLAAAIANNGFNTQHARTVLDKESWFRENKDRCLWDVRQDWYEIYKESI